MFRTWLLLLQGNALHHRHIKTMSCSSESAWLFVSCVGVFHRNAVYHRYFFVLNYSLYTCELPVNYFTLWKLSKTYRMIQLIAAILFFELKKDTKKLRNEWPFNVKAAQITLKIIKLQCKRVNGKLFHLWPVLVAKLEVLGLNQFISTCSLLYWTAIENYATG